jgi:formate dehydrogenase assembly factor FdhD
MIKWRIQFMCALRKRLEYLETGFSIEETLCTSISEWLETGTVDVNNYPAGFHAAINTQTTIGW